MKAPPLPNKNYELERGKHLLKKHPTYIDLMFKKYFAIMIFIVLFTACSRKQKMAHPLANALASKNQKIRRVMDHVDQFDVQIRYTQIDRKNDSIIFTDYDFQVDDQNYFYPASTVKFPTAVLTLEKLNQIDTLNRETRFYIEGDSVETTFAKAISEIFAVSNNEANNRLLEFLGQDAINKRLRDKGVRPVRISHRLGVHDDDVTTKPLVIYMNDSTIATSERIINTPAGPLQLNRIKKGRGFYDEGSLINEPFDFSLKNYYPITAQHGVLKRLIFPENFSKDERFDLNEDQREFLLTAMHTLPKEMGYDPITHFDSYCKFFIFGDTKEAIPDDMKIYNKVGFAYGTLTDCAYITDTKNHLEFLLTATLLVNKNGIFNDDSYEYDEIGIPFLAQLGREIYKYEMNRKK